jgi:hypothetical protein
MTPNAHTSNGGPNVTTATINIGYISCEILTKIHHHIHLVFNGNSEQSYLYIPAFDVPRKTSGAKKLNVPALDFVNDPGRKKSDKPKSAIFTTANEFSFNLQEYLKIKERGMPQ